MKNNKWLSLLAPVALMALGLVLFFVPDTGSILLSKILGWGLTLVGILAIFWTVFAREWRKLVIGIVLVGIGSVLLAKPLALAAFVGRILGVVVAFRGILEWAQSATRQGSLGLNLRCRLSASTAIFCFARTQNTWSFVWLMEKCQGLFSK